MGMEMTLRTVLFRIEVAAVVGIGANAEITGLADRRWAAVESLQGQDYLALEAPP